MLDPKALANASAVMVVIIYLVCVMLLTVAPDLILGFLALTTHSINVELLRSATALNLVNVMIGGTLWVGLTWPTFYFGASLYNNFRKK